MYEMRFAESVDPSWSLQQIRGHEGIRVRRTYEGYSAATGVAWSGRNYDRKSWNNSDPINRALSSANACLYGVCHSAILSVGCSAALGFVHTGRQLSFVYDIADLYKTEITIPTAFAVVGDGIQEVERRARQMVRDVVIEKELLKRVVPDLQALLDMRRDEGGEGGESEERDPDSSLLLPGELWQSEGSAEGGINWGAADEP